MSIKIIQKSKITAKQRRHARVRKSISGTADRPRLVVFRGNKHIFAQIVDDTKGVTIASASTMSKNLRSDKGNKTDKALAAGKQLADAAKAAKIKKVVFDTGGNKYHGRVAALANGAREGGLEF
ncbi:MAG: 50S ribosomal protein L18 [Bifidobacteriaceae bacterium]|jgi:large subunit ribosomal protein L18|nr:50S ribosomal protein L18 [Bifidobacteriaceae bacterium]